jgi:acyl carrier protein
MNIHEFIGAVADIFEETDCSLFQEDTQYQTLDEWDSITALSLIAMIKTKMGKIVTGKEIRSCHTINELFRLIDSK